MKVIRHLIALLVLCSIPSLDSFAALSTLPAGSTVHTDCGMNTTARPICANLDNPYNAGTIVSDPSAPYDPPSVYHSERCPSCTSGGTQLDTFNAAAQEYYVGTTMMTSPNFCGYPNGGNKINMPGNTESTSYLHLRGSVDCVTAPRLLDVAFNNQNGGTLNNCHYAPNYNGTQAQITGGTIYGDCPGGVVMFSNLSGTKYQTGRWNDLEWCGKASTSRTSKDGIYAWKLNGETLAFYGQTNSGPGGWFQNFHTYTWDGSGTGWGVTAWHRLARHRVATLPAGGCAALMSQSQPPPPGDTTPPGRATGLVVTQLN